MFDVKNSDENLLHLEIKILLSLKIHLKFHLTKLGHSDSTTVGPKHLEVIRLIRKQRANFLFKKRKALLLILEYYVMVNNNMIVVSFFVIIEFTFYVI